MAALTIRNLSEAVHEWLRGEASARQMSVEALCRVLLADGMRQDKPASAQGAGMSEAPVGCLYPSKAGAKQTAPDLWGALHGSVHVPGTTDLTASLFESWNAAD